MKTREQLCALNKTSGLNYEFICFIVFTTPWEFSLNLVKTADFYLKHEEKRK